MAFTRASAASKLTENTNNGKSPEKIAKAGEQLEELEPVRSSVRLTRSKSAGIYDSQNGKACHQCGQKTSSVAVSCKNRNGGKQCSFHYCHSCLLNRYDEKAEDVAALGSKWKCPCCRGVCNCGECTEKRGCALTGKLKRNGSAAGMKQEAEESATSSKRTRCKSGLDEQEKSGVGKKGGASSKVPSSKASGGKGNVVKGKEKKGAVATCRKGPVKQEAANRTAVCKKRKATTEASTTSSKRARRKSDLDENDKSGVGKKGDASSKVPKTKATAGKGNAVKGKEIKRAIATCRKDAKCSTTTKRKTTGKRKNQNVELLISQATQMTKVANLDLPAEDIGHALQFLEFCEAFGQVLDLKKGQAESLLQEITCGEDMSRCDFSLERLHVKLLSMIGKDSDDGYSSLKARGRNSWLEALDKYISGCSNAPESLVLACLQLSREGYSKLDGSKKLRILTFLCDEALSTTELRMWIGQKNLEFVQERKKVKKMLLDEEKNNRVKLKKGTEINKEDSHHLTHSDTAGSAHNSTVIRSNPVLRDPSGRKFWKLSSCSEGVHVLLQDVAHQDNVTSEEKWFAYGLKHKVGIEKYISSVKESLQAGV